MATDYYALASDTSLQYGIPGNLLTDIIGAESGFNSNAYNPASGATGIAQFLPSTAANPGYGIKPFDPTDPVASIKSAGAYLSALFNKTGSWLGAVSAYSGTPAGGTPYPGNAAIAADLAGAGGSGGAAAPSGSTGAGSGFLGTLGSWLANYTARWALVLLAVILLAGGVFLLGERSIHDG